MKAVELIFLFVFLYPLFMALFWMMGSLLFFFRREQISRTPPKLAVFPQVSILVPCHNEELIIRDVIEQLNRNDYPNFEIIAINDASTDSTGDILRELAQRHERLRVVTLSRNYGKAMALRAGVLAASSEFLMCIDADALLAKDALYWMMDHFLDGPRVGAVTGNPRVANRTSLLARIQIGEFSAIIGMVKRSQRNLGRIFTVSGVNACYRRAALHDVGYWSPQTMTEDIDISWRLQLKRWDIRFEPRAITWILVPDNLRMLWRQRLRWAQGGIEAAIRYGRDMKLWANRRMWSVFAEYAVGVAWCYAFLFTVLCWAGTQLFDDRWPAMLNVPTLVPGWTGVILAVTCLLQFLVGLYIDSYYERRGLLRFIFWAIWYPAIYWVINAVTTVVAVPKGIREYGRTRYAVWKSPVRRMRDLLYLVRRRKAKQRHLLVNDRVATYSRRLAVTTITIVFWVAWTYLVMPLLSLLLWLVGVHLFVDRMIEMGGYQGFADRMLGYGIAVLIMAFMLALWVYWNRKRYGGRKRERRTARPAHVSEARMAKSVGLSPTMIATVRTKKEMSVDFERENRPRIEWAK